MIAALAAVMALVATGCESCEDDADCMVACDCDGDGESDRLFAHDCNGGVCDANYNKDVQRGCETLCEDDLGD